MPPSAQLGLEAYAAEAQSLSDWELADRWRYGAWALNEVAAIVGMRREAQALDEHRAEQAAPATLKGGVISGSVPYRPQDCPAWIDDLFPEGEIGSMLPPTPLEALI